MSDINPGDEVRLSVHFTDMAGDDADPTTVSLTIRPKYPKGGIAETFSGGELDKDAVGLYHLDYTVPSIDPDHGMNFYYEWRGTGAVAVVEPGVFNVSDPGP